MKIAERFAILETKLVYIERLLYCTILAILAQVGVHII